MPKTVRTAKGAKKFGKPIGTVLWTGTRHKRGEAPKLIAKGSDLKVREKLARGAGFHGRTPTQAEAQGAARSGRRSLTRWAPP